LKELVENRGIGPDLIVFYLRELRENYSLNIRLEIEVDVVELSSGITNSFAIDS
jgi:hypothetical protein